MKVLINILMLIVGFVLFGCVGTVEDNAKIDNSKIKKAVKLNFRGISTCYSVSDKKIEVVFPSANISSGSVDPNTLVYKVYLNGDLDNSVASMMAQDLRSDSSGNYHLEINNLNLNTAYSIMVRAQDPQSGVEDNNTSSCAARTMDQKFPIFDGVVEVYTYPGVQGQNSLLLKWNTAKAAEYLLGGIPVNGHRIVKYNIYQSPGTDDPEAMTLLTSISENSVAPITQFQASGLVQGQHYFYMIRAVDETNREEKNRIVRSASTATPQNVAFSGIQTLTVPANTSGYTTLRATWPKPNGDFNRYRVFAIPEGSPVYGSTTIDPNDATYRVVEITDVSKQDSLVVGLTPDTTYEVYVVACMFDGVSCVTKAGDKKKLEATTTPPLSPFGGITSITPQSGALGLNNVTLNWSAPATTAGVCNGINLYEKGNAIKTCGDPTLGPEDACVNSSANCSSTSIDVANLKTGKQYCFSARVFEGTREQSFSVVERCVTTEFDAPVFQNPPTCIADDTGTKVKIDWILPNPSGLYNNFLVFAKKDDGLPLNPVVWQETAKAIYEGTQVDLSAPNDKYKNFLRPKSGLTYTVSGLSPDTNYRFLVKTVMNVGGQYYYDKGTTVISCKTKPLTLQFGGWKHILAVGPRISGIADHRDAPSTESLTVNPTGNYSMGNVNFETHGIEPETLAVTNTITYPKVVRDNPTVTKSKNGLVQLMWSEFKTADGSNIDTWLYNQGLSVSPGDGYFIYRKVTASATNSAEYESSLNQVQNSSSGWVLLNPNAPIAMDATTKTGMYVDALPDGFHPVHSSNGTIAFRDKANTGKVVWYTVRFKLDGNLLGFQNNVNKDAILPVIIPPANMASIHHWMANRKMCELMNKDFDRNNEYKCIYGGLASKNNGEQSYYDAGGHILVDRWALGCNITRYDEQKACKNTNSVSIPLNHGTTGTYNGVSTGAVGWAPAYSLDADLKHGDCIGVSTPIYFPNAPKGAVYYNTQDTSCYIRVQEMLTGVPDWNQTNAWKRIIGYTDFSTDKAESNRLPPAIGNEILNRVYPSNNDPENMKGVGNILTSNDSSLPPITEVTHAQGHFLCQSHAITLQTGNSNSLPIRKRHVSSREFVTMSLPHPNTTDTERSLVELGYPSSYPAYSISIDSSTRYILGRDTNTKGQCNTRDTGWTSTNSGEYGRAQYANKLTKFVSRGGPLPVNPMTLVSGSYDVGGVFGRNEGTERCVSGFGVQDHIGNTDFWLSEQMLCQANADGTNGECFTNPTDIMISSFETANTVNRWPASRYFSTDKKFYGQDDFKNSNNNSFSYNLYIDQGFTTSFGVPQESKTLLVNPNTSSYSYPYVNSYYYSPSYIALQYPFRHFEFNPVLGVPLNCDSGLCHQDDQVEYSFMTWPLNFGTMVDKYFELRQRSTVTANSYFTKYRRRGLSKSAQGYQNGTSNSNEYTQLFRLDDGTNEWVLRDKYYHRYSMDWMLQNNETDTTLGVRCAVKVKLNIAGTITAVDDQNID